MNVWLCHLIFRIKLNIILKNMKKMRKNCSKLTSRKNDYISGTEKSY